MDKNADTVYADLTSCNHRISNFLTYLTACKSLRFEVLDLGMRRFPAIRYRGVSVDGLPAATEYVLETRPYPEIMPERPERRAIIRNFVGMILLYEMDLRELEPLYAQYPGKRPHQINLLDIAVAACDSDRLSHELQWIRAIARDVETMVKANEPGVA